MNTTIRAKRILSSLTRFEFSDNSFDKKLGEKIGFYTNSTGVQVEFFENGICWQEKGKSLDVAFKDILAVELVNEKESNSLAITTDNERYEVPFDGSDGKCFDSLEVLRFFFRVSGDLVRASKIHDS